MKEEDIEPIGEDLKALASRYGIEEFVFMYCSENMYGHLSGNIKGTFYATRLIGLIEAVRICVREELARASNQEDKLKREARKKMDGEG